MLGNAPAHKLFDLIGIQRNDRTEGPARSFKDYDVTVGTAPAGVEVIEKLEGGGEGGGSLSPPSKSRA